ARLLVLGVGAGDRAPAARAPRRALLLACLRRIALGRAAAAPRAPRGLRRAPAVAGGGPHDLAVLVEQRRAGGGAPDLVDPHHAVLAHAGGGAGDGDDVAVDFRDRVVDVVHVRLDDLDEHFVSGPERQRALLGPPPGPH